MEAIKVSLKGEITEVMDTSLKGLQEAVGGYIQVVYLNVKPYEYKGKRYDIMLVDDDGLMKVNAVNSTGLEMYKMNTKPNDSVIVGDVVFTTSKVWN